MITAGKVYLSGPISGLSYNEARYGWRRDLARQLHPGIHILSPMRHEGHLAELLGPIGTEKDIKEKAEYQHYFSTSKGIRAKDHLDVEQADVIVVCVLGATEISMGTVMEMGWADWANKLVVLVIEKEGNLHDRFFFTDAAKFRVETIEEAAAIVNSLLSTGL